jgi:alanine racemase
MLSMPDSLSAADYRLARPLWAEVSLSAIGHNLSEVKRLVGPAVKIIASVKGDAYGLGIVPVGRHLEKLGVNALATANFDDAVAVRKSGVRIPIVMFAGNLPSGLGALLDYDLTPTVCDLDTAKIVSKLATRRVNVHVKVDAGLGRLGVKLRDARSFIRAIAQLPGINVQGVYTHIPFSNDVGEAWSRRRLVAFTELIDQIQSVDGLRLDYAQACASPSIACEFPDTLNTITPGELLYGIRPVQRQLLGWPFKSALKSVKASLTHIAHHQPGDDLVISGQYTLRSAMRTGVILFGRDNGFRTPAVPDAYVLCRGKRCAIVGVSAEYTVIDLANAENARIGDEVTVIGRDGDESIGLEEMGEYLGVGALYVGMSLHRIPINYLENDVA